MRFVFFVSVFLLVLFVSCRAIPAPQPVEEVPQPESIAPPAEPVPPVESVEPPIEPEPAPEPILLIEEKDDDDESTFDPASVTVEEFNTVKMEVQRLISNLNTIIHSKNYKGWVSYLAPAYVEYISSPEFLTEINREPRLKSQRIALSGPEDYFSRVVVPSRDHDRVDDIEFITHKRVKAFTILRNGDRLRLYDLLKTDEGWKIIR
ncbi:MAG: hypothetical protein LBG76_11260 [Treponema sp.]|jgi:hypothetical protein|nr:hypothetical protein [Treponema sp.]